MQKFSEVQFAILERLGQCYFLTVQQMMDLGIAKSKSTMSKHLTQLTQRQATKKLALINYIDFGTFPTIGRIPRLYYLTKAGVTTIAEYLRIEPESIPHPKGWKLFERDYFHRVQTIDVHIAARKFAEHIPEMEFDFFQSYFEHTGANHSNNPQHPKRQALTTTCLQDGTKFVPDAVFQLTDPSEERKPWLFGLEVYRGHTTKRTYDQLVRHLWALSEGAISKKYHYDRSVRVLVVCEAKPAMMMLQKRIRESTLFVEALPYFLFAHLEDVKTSFVDSWEDYHGHKVNPFAV